MKQLLTLFCCCIFWGRLPAQTITQKLQRAFHAFENDAQLQYASVGFYVINAKTGKVIFDKNSRVGMAPASTQKIITAATAFELLGKDFRYTTDFAVKNADGKSDVYIYPSGDPSFGSWRWESTREDKIVSRVATAIQASGTAAPGNIIINAPGWNTGQIPDGWIWQDIGNYYGAGAAALNWRENQFDLLLQSGKNIGDSVKIKGTKPVLYKYAISSLAVSAASGTGDNSYIYLPVNNQQAVVRGTIPIHEDNFTVSGSLPDPARQFAATLLDSLQRGNQQIFTTYEPVADKGTIIYSAISPSLDSLIYWFLKKSINLYGEALLKTMALEKTGVAATDSGVVLLQHFWKEKGLDPAELNLYDGSGLSPLNRVTAHAQVKVLKYAARQSWFPLYLHAFPLYNGMTMKSGSISDVKSFCGYQTSHDGNSYIFSFLVNNYNGPATALVNKMYRVLDVLK
jgi:D-alanyl-D-alanine carboxypeptidase/D-alanyl-D-alanine-endopeptidase (penicillin-binding protein 4)